MAALKYWIWLGSLPGVSSAAAAKLLEKLGDPEKIFFSGQSEYEAAGVDKRACEALMNKSLGRVYEILDSCEAAGITPVAMGDASYPQRLKAIYDPPAVLYVRGSALNLDAAAVAVVGTRSCTPYGVKSAEKMGYELAREGCIVVSGLAKGIDSAAARGALRAGGTVVGVVGSGPDIAYPAENARLFDDVAKSGGIISEYPPKTPVKGGHFPARNRIISGVSLGVVVIEAPRKSGSLITAALALEQGRDVFVVPANVDSPASQGSNLLIREGAVPVFSGKDVADEYRGLFPETMKNARENAGLDKKQEKRLLAEELPKKREKLRASKKVIDKNCGGDYDLKKPSPPLSPEETAICEILKQGRLHANDIIEQSGLPAGQVMATLTMLEIKGTAIQEKGKFFRLTTD